MLLGALLLLVAGAALVAGSGLMGSGLAGVAEARRLPAETVRATAIGLGGALAATVVAVGEGRTALGSGVPFGAALFLLASAFGAAALLGRRQLEVREPVTFAAPAAAVVLMALSLSTDRSLTRVGGVLLTVVFVPYLAWILLDPGREPADGVDEPPRPDPWPAAGGWPGADDVRGRVTATHASPPSGTGNTTATARPETAAAPDDSPRGRTGSLGLAGAGVALVVGGAFAVVEGATLVAEHAPLVPGFAGAALAGSLVALPFTLLVVFPRRERPGSDVSAATLTVVTGLLTFVPGVAAVVRPFELDGAAAVSVLATAALYALPATWMLLRGRGSRVMGGVVLGGYAACLLIMGSL